MLVKYVEFFRSVDVSSATSATSDVLRLWSSTIYTTSAVVDLAHKN